MSRKLTVIPEQCSDCRICELVCAIKHFGANNPKKAAIRVINTYPHPVMRMPVVCAQCKVPACAKVCPTDALRRDNGVVVLDREACISCFKCVEACPFGAIYAHEDCDHPIKCDMCGGDPECVKNCPLGALRLTVSVVTEAHQMNPSVHKRDHRSWKEEAGPHEDHESNFCLRHYEFVTQKTVER